MRTFNITETYIDKYNPWSGILAEEEFAMIKTTNILRCYSTGQLLFGGDMILLIKHKVDW